ncbi:MAG: signal recognition particle-docking protein FtsY, partial [Lachnospiraceae bacterium]|nr:signal recognition particle-docking protein FtsY [Lachnospiraceae bacterium]
MGFFSRLFAGLAKARNSIMSGLDEIFSGFSQIDDDFYEEIEEILVMADLGITTASNIIENLKEKVKEQRIKEPAACKELLVQTIKEQMDIGETAYEFEHRQSVLLVVGVNGVGKTTTIGKLAAQYIREGKTVVLAAADTFRAAAADQLEIWAERAGAALVRQHEGADPASVVYDACQSAKAKNADILIVDTAGRLHNKKNLMEELKKINRVIDREFPGTYRETLVVLDGTTGQNALVQARQFKEAVNISGIVLTKMDGTAKGGIAVAIQAELGVPVKYIGVGEQIDDLQKFNADSFVNALFDIQMDDQDDEAEEAGDGAEAGPGSGAWGASGAEAGGGYGAEVAAD